MVLRHNEKPTWLYKRLTGPSRDRALLPPPPLGDSGRMIKAVKVASTAAWQHLLLPMSLQPPDLGRFSLPGSESLPDCFLPSSDRQSRALVAWETK